MFSLCLHMTIVHLITLLSTVCKVFTNYVPRLQDIFFWSKVEKSSTLEVVFLKYLVFCICSFDKGNVKHVLCVFQIQNNNYTIWKIFQIKNLGCIKTSNKINIKKKKNKHLGRRSTF